MALVLKDGSIFLHVPKTGGNWVTTILDKCNLIADHIGEHKHVDVDRVLLLLANNNKNSFRSRFKQRFGFSAKDKPFMFCFVRHPLSWYESWFKYMSQTNRNWCDWGDEKSMDSWHPNSILNGMGSPDFNQFVRNVNKKRPGYVTEQYGWYTKPHVDFVGKQETLKEDLIRVLKTLELDFDEDLIRDFSKVGVSKKPANEITWDPELRNETYKLEYAGIVRHGYQHDNPM